MVKHVPKVKTPDNDTKIKEDETPKDEAQHKSKYS